MRRLAAWLFGYREWAILASQPLALPKHGIRVMTPAPTQSNDESGSRLRAALANGYRIERELGAGGMATVYLAHDLKHDRKVA